MANWLYNFFLTWAPDARLNSQAKRILWQERSHENWALFNWFFFDNLGDMIGKGGYATVHKALEIFTRN